MHQGVSVQGGLCPGAFSPGLSVQEVSVWGERSLSEGVSVQGGLCLGVSVWVGSLSKG